MPRDLGQFNLLQTGNLNLKSLFLRIEFIFDIRIIMSIKLKIKNETNKLYLYTNNHHCIFI